MNEDYYVVTGIETPLRGRSSGARRAGSVSNGLAEGGGMSAKDAVRGVASSSRSLPYGDCPYENGDAHAKEDFLSGCGVATMGWWFGFGFGLELELVGPGSELFCREWLSSMTDSTLRSLDESDLRGWCPGRDSGGTDWRLVRALEGGETERGSGGVLDGEGTSAHSVASEV